MNDFEKHLAKREKYAFEIYCRLLLKSESKDYHKHVAKIAYESADVFMSVDNENVTVLFSKEDADAIKKYKETYGTNKNQ